MKFSYRSGTLLYPAYKINFPNLNLLKILKSFKITNNSKIKKTPENKEKMLMLSKAVL